MQLTLERPKPSVPAWVGSLVTEARDSLWKGWRDGLWPRIQKITGIGGI